MKHKFKVGDKVKAKTNGFNASSDITEWRILIPGESYIIEEIRFDLLVLEDDPSLSKKTFYKDAIFNEFSYVHFESIMDINEAKLKKALGLE